MRVSWNPGDWARRYDEGGGIDPEHPLANYNTDGDVFLRLALDFGGEHFIEIDAQLVGVLPAGKHEYLRLRFVNPTPEQLNYLSGYVARIRPGKSFQ